MMAKTSSSAQKELDNQHDEDEAILDEALVGLKLSNARIQRQARQARFENSIATLYLPSNLRLIPLGESVSMLMKCEYLEANVLTSRNANSDPSVVCEKYFEQLRLAYYSGEIQLIDPITRLPESREREWDNVQEHFIVREQFDQFALIRLGIEIKDEALAKKVTDNTMEFNTDSPYYPMELDIALRAWRAVTVDKKPSAKRASKKQIEEWLNANAKHLSPEAIKRIAIVCNWKKRGGAPKTSE